MVVNIHQATTDVLATFFVDLVSQLELLPTDEVSLHIKLVMLETAELFR